MPSRRKIPQPLRRHRIRTLFGRIRPGTSLVVPWDGDSDWEKRDLIKRVDAAMERHAKTRRVLLARVMTRRGPRVMCVLENYPPVPPGLADDRLA